MAFSAVPKLFIAGLGNAPYPSTRHSIGHLVIDALAARLGINMKSQRGGISGQGNVFVGKTLVDLTLFKANALMNISGPPIVKAYRQTVNSPTSMIVLTDSLSHRPCSLSVKLGGSAEGHNGVKSIIAASGGPDFYRFRIGIGRDGTDAAEYVLQRLSSHERHFWNNEGLDLVVREVEKVALKTG